MFVIGNLLDAVAAVLNIVLNGLMVILVVNALLSWVRPDPDNPIVRFLDRVSDVVCAPIRRMFPTSLSGIDFAPFLAMLGILLIQQFLVRSLSDIAVRMR
ncbi:MAG: YggT family protein [Candidatus Eisenbacteria bacterium]|uniref:YggT family protein n=1 Tax=Eiseniibacteriota bacterium TaxID=2212470 RepID=A0A849SBH3_UNCEI|nr:YggT family protein [Candidatus Eisenbacteria bacterium]